ncbi:hypothetical protein OQA88_7763 [Cercophora sp. LCS_1]
MSSDVEAHPSLYLPPSGTPTITPSPRYEPSPSQTLIRTLYSAINPGDLRHFHMGMSTFIMGYDFIGTVITPSSTSSYQPGDILLGMTKPGHQRPLYTGAHQAYILLEDDRSFVWKCPADLDHIKAVRITSSVLTASDALFNILGFGFKQAGVDGDDATGEPLLIWGGAGSVGWATVQLAREAGFSPILVVAGERNHEVLKEAGATMCFGYGEDVADRIRQTVSEMGVNLRAVVDAVGVGLGIFEPGDNKVVYEKSSPALAKRCLSGEEKRLACVLPVLQDSDWTFALYSRRHDEEQVREYPGWAERQERVVSWVLKHHQRWKAWEGVKIVTRAEEAREAVIGAFEGTLQDKVVIQHPMQ